MTSALLLGLGFGVGVILVLSGLVPARPPLALALERLHQQHPALSTTRSGNGSCGARQQTCGSSG